MALEKPYKLVVQCYPNLNNNMKIYYVNALAGSGKTHSAIDYALSQAGQGNKVAIVQPSTILLDQTFNDLKAHKKNIGLVQIKKYHAKNTTNVKDTVSDHLRATRPDAGEILLITHQTLLSLPYWHNSKEWDIIVDEIPQIEDSWTGNLPINHAVITNHIKVIRTGKEYCPISIADNDAAQAEILRMAECRLKDEQDKIYQSVCQKLVGYKTWMTYTNVNTWDRIVANEEMGQHQITTFSIMQPEAIVNNFKSVTIMGAMFTHSVLYMLWQGKVTFAEHEEITKGMRNNSGVHQNGNLLTIKYFLEDNWSKYMKTKMVGEMNLMNTIKQQVEDMMGTTQYIYAKNNDDAALDLGIVVPNVCHGMNKYQHIHNVVFLSALNPTSANFNFMSENNVSAEDLRKARGHQTLYQTVMRSSLRNPEDQNAKMVVVMDRESAEYLAAYFPGCTVEAIAEAPVVAKKNAGRPKADKPAMTSAERQRLRRERLKAEKAAK